MLHALIAIIGVFLTICFVVGTHEAGHFVVARLVGVKVLTFSIGFGKSLLRWHDKSGTEYVFAMIPLGGYVRMLDESEGIVEPKDLPRAYNNQPFYKKFLIIAAGPATNFISAFVLYWIIFTTGFITVKPVTGVITPHSIAANAGMQPMQQIIGIDNHRVDTWMNVLFGLLRHTGDQDQVSMQVRNLNNQKEVSLNLALATWKMDDLNPDPFQSLGFVPFEPPMKLIIGEISKDSAAAHSPLAIGDTIQTINHVPVREWYHVVNIIQSHPDQTVDFTVLRAGKPVTMPVKIGSEYNWNLTTSGVLGIAPKVDFPPFLLQTVQYSAIGSLGKAWQEVSDLTYFNILLFGKMLTGKVSLESLGGPITIFSSAGSSLNYGLLPFLKFLAFLSVSIGLINIFPIPGLDGGHLFLQSIEAISRRKIPDRVIFFLYRVGFAFLLLIMIQAMVNDVMRLF